MCLTFTYVGVIQQSMYETKIHDIDDLRKCLIIIIIIIITRLMTHVKVIHRVKNRKCGRSQISEGKLGCKVQSLPIV